MGSETDKDVYRKERREVAEDLLRDVPSGAGTPKAKSRWIAAGEEKPDPRSVY